ncbi:MAG: ribonuclease III [Alphaproteobacteria bacterium]|nr:MAG: ribonuclease III [Alphaproteobacteria bacterium]
MPRADKAAAWAAKVLGHRFGDPALLAQALTHPSFESARSYQRLEFLGDRVLGLVIAHWLFAHFKGEPEGRLATRFTGLVRRETLADIARRLGIGAWIKLASGARDEGAHDKDSVLADVCEALIGAMYLDGGLAAAQAFIHAQWAGLIADGPGARKDAKTRLQEWVQGRGLPAPTYREVARSGPAHLPHFVMEVLVEGETPHTGEGRTKREAEQRAAKAMLGRLKTLQE